MTLFKNVCTLSGERKDILALGGNQEIDCSHLLALPALIDPHVHFRSPGAEYKEDWKSGGLAAITSGVTTVFDMPNNTPPCTTLEKLREKKALIEAQLKAIDVPLRYGLYFGADKNSLDQIPLAKKEPYVVGLKIFMGCSTGGLVIDSDEDLDTAFRLAAESNLLVAVHAEDEAILKARKKEFGAVRDPAFHSKIRSKEAAIWATEKAISLCAKYQTPLYILHLSTKEELELVRQAKKQKLPVYAEATTHHLFFTIEDYARLGTLVQMNPPIRTKEDQEALWLALNDGTIDTLGTDHAPHTLEEKQRGYGEAPSGIPGIETLLPLMLNAVYEKRITLERLVALTRTNIEKLFSLPNNEDLVLVDLNLEKKVDPNQMRSKCGWTPYAGMRLRGWPVYTILKNRAYAASGRKTEGKEEGSIYPYKLKENSGIKDQKATNNFCGCQGH